MVIFHSFVYVYRRVCCAKKLQAVRFLPSGSFLSSLGAKPRFFSLEFLWNHVRFEKWGAVNHVPISVVVVVAVAVVGCCCCCCCCLGCSDSIPRLLLFKSICANGGNNVESHLPEPLQPKLEQRPWNCTMVPQQENILSRFPNGSRKHHL